MQEWSAHCARWAWRCIFDKALIRAGRMNFVAIDFETANTAQNSACAVGLVKVVDSAIVETVAYLIRPPSKKFEFTYIHRLTWNDVKSAPDFGALWPALSAFIAGAEFLAAHYAAFDRGVFHACCASYGIPAPPVPFRCTVQLARKTWNIRPTKLPNVCERLGIPLNHHEALSDARACAAIVLAANLERSRAVAGNSAVAGVARSTSRIRPRANVLGA